LAIIVCSYLPGEGCCLKSERYEVTRVECRRDYDYWKGLARAWATDEVVVNIEHDLEVYDDDIADLLACRQPLCSRAYPCHWVTTGLGRDVFPMGPDRWHGQEFIEEGTEWAQWSAIGFIKVSPAARTRRLPIARWTRLEIAVEDTITPPWHLHWPPVRHHHW
jgi:hypothetical protein